MRYVIAMCALTGAILWDAAYYDSHYANLFLKTLTSYMRAYGLMH